MLGMDAETPEITETAQPPFEQVPLIGSLQVWPALQHALQPH